MHVLGIADGPDASAALCVDDRLVAFEKQASFDANTRNRAFPWDAAVDVLRRSGSTREDVRTVAVAGRFTPPLMLRKQPVLRRAAANAFSGTLDLGVFYQAMLRQTGMGALQADNAADWLATKLATRGFRGKLELVDIHTALANAVYRFQDRDDVLICTLHPLGDGVALALHRAAFGQVDRVFEQRGFSRLHVHLHRCAQALGCENSLEMWTLAGSAAFDRSVVETLEPLLHGAGDRLSRAKYPLPTGRRVYRVLRTVDRAVAAASVRENLRRAVCAVLAHHVSKHDCADLLLAGEGFSDPLLVQAAREVSGVESVFALPDPGYGSLAIGAAATASGLVMRRVEPDAVDPEVRGAPDASAVRKALLAGRPVLRFSGCSVIDPFAKGDRCVWSLYDGAPLGPLERAVGVPGPLGTTPLPGSLLEQVADVGPIRLQPIRFAGKPILRLSQVATVARSKGALVAAGEA